jgi:defect-in-organelle-trafficking protein DotA
MYVLIVQKSFTLISYLPDKILRWIGGSPESLGTEAAGWGEEIKRDQIDKAGTGTQQAQGQMGKQMGGYAQKGISAGMGAIKGALGGGGKTSGKGGEGGQTGPSSTPSSGGSPPAPPVPPG